MNNSASRDNILNKIKQVAAARKVAALVVPESNSPVFKAVEPSLLACFKNELETVAGSCTICKSETDLIDQLKEYLKEQKIDFIFCRDQKIKRFLEKNKIAVSDSKEDFKNMQAGITPCEFLVARTGSVLVSSQGDSGRQMQVFPPIHIVLAKKEQVLAYVSDALDALEAKYKGETLPSMVSFVSGPSRTADIEKTLVLGAHGPKALHVFIQE